MVLLAYYSSFACAESFTAKFIQDMVSKVHYKELKATGTFYNNVAAFSLFEHLKRNCGGLYTANLINLPTNWMLF